MSKAAKLIAHQKRWDIEVSDNSIFEAFRGRIYLLTNKILRDRTNHLSAMFWQYFLEEFNLLLGYEVFPQSEIIRSPQHSYFKGLESCQSLKDLVNYLQISLIIIESNFDNEAEKAKTIFTKVLIKALELSPQISVSIAKSNNQIILYPKGASLLDEAVVNQNLSWLESHPNVLKPFVKALIYYMGGNKTEHRALLDNLRVALEQLLRNILKNKKPLEKQKELLLPWLKTQRINQHIIDMYDPLLKKFIDFQNEDVKHSSGEEFTENDIEFMIYLTGTFMRLLLQLEQKALKS